MSIGNGEIPIILLVEDNIHDEELSLRALAKSSVPHTVVVVRDGMEAAEMLANLGNSGSDEQALPAVVLLDLKLPKMSGHDVLRRIRENPATAILPVVILTTSGEERDILQSYELGANSYIRKPVSFTEFCEIATELVDYWLTKNRPPVANQD